MQEKTNSYTGSVLFNKTQQLLLTLLYGNPEQSYYLTQIMQLLNIGRGTIVRELEKFTQAGLLSEKRIGNQRHYQANQNNPIYKELKSITDKTFGQAGIIKFALQDHEPDIIAAFVYGSIAKGTEHAGSDVDVFILSDTLSYSATLSCLEVAEQQLNRKIEPTVMNTGELLERLLNKQSFIGRVIDQKKIWLLGKEKFETLIGHEFRPGH